MIDSCLPLLLESIYGKSIPSVLQDLTGVSAKTWMKPSGPKRPSTLEKAKHNSELLGLEHLLKEGWSADQAQQLARYVKGSAEGGFGFATLVRMSSLPGKFEYPDALAMAEHMDAFSGELRTLRGREDFEGFRQAMLGSGYCRDLRDWSVATADEAAYESLERSTRLATNWDALDPALSAIATTAIYQLLAMWELEFQSVFFNDQRTGDGLSPQAIVRLLMPRTKFGFDRTPYGTFPAPRGLLHLPLRRLLYFCYCVSELHNTGKWPHPTRVTRTFVAAAARILRGADDSHQPLASISRGTRNLTCEEFRRVWADMCDLDNVGEAPMPPWPLYFATQLMTILYVRKDIRATTALVTSIVLVNPAYYDYWWKRFFASLRAKGIAFGRRPWPDYLTSS